MPIKFRCPNPSCGKPLTVSDGAAGRQGKCPGCGSPLVVPQPGATADESPYELDDMAAAAATPPPLISKPSSVTALRDDDPAWLPDNEVSGNQRVVSFGAIGQAWDLLKQQMGTWILAVIVVGLAQSGCQIALNFLLAIVGAIEMSLSGMRFPLSSIAFLPIGIMIQGVLIGGLYKLALKQIDGGEIKLGDAFSIGGAGVGLGVVALLITLLTSLGFLFLIIPGIIFTGLAMFTVPAVLEGHGPIDAIKLSVGTLKREWLRAIGFVLVSWLILVSGAMLFGIGMLFTFPLYILAATVQYRRSFARGGVERKAVVADPRIGVPGTERGPGRMPIWAWGLAGLGLLMPVVMIAVLAALIIPAFQKAAQVAAQRNQMGNPAMKGQQGFAGPVAPGRGLRMRPGANPPNGGGSGPVDGIEQALDTTVERNDGRPIDIGFLIATTPDNQHRRKVVAELTPLLNDPKMGGDAARALEQWASKVDVPMLIDGLSSGQVRVRMFLFRALARLKPDEAIPVLVEHLAIAADRGEASRALQAIGPKVVPAVQPLLTSEDRETRQEAARLLQAIGGNDPNAQRSTVVNQLSSPDSGEVDRALQTLARSTADDESRDQVLSAILPLLKSPTASTRANALKAIAIWGTEEQVPAIIETLEDSDRNVQVSAVAALRKFPGKPAALAYAGLLNSKTVRKDATDALVALKLKDNDVEAEVLKALTSTDAATRQAACQVLRVIGTVASIPALQKATGDERRNVANAARAALTAIDPTAQPETPAAKPKMKAPPTKKRGN